MLSSIPASTFEKFTTFGDLLRFLRRRAGITQVELAIAVGYSDAQISRLEQNLRLPDIPTIAARFVPALGLEDEPNVVARLLDLAANVRREDAPGLGLCPYKGLNYFDEADADLFVGREALTSKVTERVLSLTSSESPHELRFLAVVGASGSGKSSLVRAGLVPALRWNKKAADWNIHMLTPTAHPLESLAASLTLENRSVTTTATLMDDLACDSRSLQLFVKRNLRSENNTCLLLVVDQFEEVFALCRSEEQRAAFIANLLTASEADGPIILVITLRADFYAHCANYIQLREALAQNQEYIGAMSDDELRRAIEEPARRGRWEFESGLVDVLLHDVGHEPGALPLLSHALLETWQRRRGRTMTLSGYASSGGVRGAIAETAEAVFTDQFSSEQRSIARRIFLRLTELSDETSTTDTRRRATFDELILKPEEATTTRTVLKTLADARLITTSEASVEVAHEALIREWPTLRNWLEENREGLRLHRQLTEAAQEWHAVGRAPDMLYRGARLARAREWASAHADEMNALEHEFLVTSIEASEREAAEREAQHQRELEAARKLAEAEKQRAEEHKLTAGQLRRRSIYLAGAFTIALIMALTALFFGAKSREAAITAHTQQRVATSRELAAASISNLSVDPERSILLALEALSANYTVEAEDALHRAVQASRVQRVINAHEPGAPMSVTFSPDGRRIVTASLDNIANVWDATSGAKLLSVDGRYAAYSPDGERLATVVSDGEVKIWNAQTGKEIPLASRVDAGLGVSFSPDGARLATITSGDLPRIWDAQTGKELKVFPGHTDFVSAAYFSHDGTRLLTAGDDRTARVWNATTGKELLHLSKHPGPVFATAFSPDEKHIATVSENVAIIWDALSGERLLTLARHTNTLYAVAFSPDGKRLATGGLDRKVNVWDATTGEEIFTLAGHTGAIYTIAFSPDGTRLATASDDGTMRLWDLMPSRELLTLSAAMGSSGQIAFNTDGTRLATTDESGAIKIKDATSGKDLYILPNPEGAIHDLHFSPDGRHIIIANDDPKVKVWDVANDKELALPSGHTGVVTAIALNSDGTRLVTASEDFKAKIWDTSALFNNNIATDPLLFTLYHPNKVFSVAFSPDDSMLATAAQDGTAILWSAKTGKEVQVFRGHAEAVLAVSFSPNGNQLATASLDGTAKLWDAASGKELFTLSGHTNAITAIAFSPDGTRIATASRDGTAKLWDASTGQELLTFLGDDSGLSDVAFSPDGTHLATGGDNGTRVYLLKIEDLIKLAQTRVTRSLTSEECQKYLHSITDACAPQKSIPTKTPLPPAANGRVCQVTNTGRLYDKSFNETIYNGLQNAAKMFQWDANVLQSASMPDFEINIKEFLRADCDLIVGTFPMQDAIRVSAETNPDRKFLMVDFLYDPPLNNVWTQTYATDQAAFLAGYVAASATKTGKVGIYGGIDTLPVTDFMDGFTRGVEYYNKKNGTSVEVLGWDATKHEGLFVGGFCCATEGRHMTEQLLNEGADIILPVAGTSIGSGAVAVVQEHGNAYFIGVDTDWAATEPEYKNIILTSIEKRFDVSVLHAVQAIVNGTFTGGIHIGTLETGEVAIAPFYNLDSLISAKVKTDVEQIKADIIAGKIKTKP